MDPIVKFIDFLTPYGSYSYGLIFAVLLACGFGFPMPEDVVLIAGGILSARGVCDFWWTNVACLAGVLIGDGIVFFLGRSMGSAVKKTWVFRRIMTEKTDQKILEIFQKYGDKVVFLGRFTPGLRMPIFMSAGIYRVPAWKFFTLDGFAALISVPIWIWVGLIFGNNIELLERKIRHFQFGIYGVLGFCVLLLLILWFFKKRNTRKN